jgi:hypothetical protein
MLKRVGKLYEGLGDFALAPAVEQKRTPALRAGSASGRSTLVAPDSYDVVAPPGTAAALDGNRMAGLPL